MNETLVKLCLELNRINHLYEQYKTIGPAGNAAVKLLKYEIERAREAIAMQDDLRMMQAYYSMRSIE